MQKHFIKPLARAVLSKETQGWLRSQRQAVRIMWLHKSSFWATRPIRRGFGPGYGRPVDRYYIEAFLDRHKADIQGSVLEVEDSNYTRRFGKGKVTLSAVLDLKPGNPRATIVADLADGIGIPPCTFDCVILTQTMQYIYNLRMAVRTLYRILKPGGVVLATFPGISPISRYDMNQWGECWRFTSLSAAKLFAETFPAEHVSVMAAGNVLAATAFLHGLVCEEMRVEELAYQDPDYELVVTVRATRPVDALAACGPGEIARSRFEGPRVGTDCLGSGRIA